MSLKYDLEIDDLRQNLAGKTIFVRESTHE